MDNKDIFNKNSKDSNIKKHPLREGDEIPHLYPDFLKGCLRNKAFGHRHGDTYKPMEMVIDNLILALIDKEHIFLKNEQKQLENQIKEGYPLLENDDFNTHIEYENLLFTISHIFEHYYLLKGLGKAIEVLKNYTK